MDIAAFESTLLTPNAPFDLYLEGDQNAIDDQLKTEWQACPQPMRLLGAAAAGFFLLSLIASGVSSSVVGTMAGQMIMQGFINFRLPIWFRRLVTMIALIIFSVRRDIMGEFRIGPLLRTLSIAGVVVVLSLNVVLLSYMPLESREVDSSQCNDRHADAN